MKRFIEGVDREQGLLFPDHLEDFVDENNPVRAVDAFVEALDLFGLGFSDAAMTGRPGYHPSVLLKIYVYGYFNRIQSSRRLELEAGRNVEVIWLTGRLAPDFKTIADFRRDNSKAIRKVVKSDNAKYQLYPQLKSQFCQTEPYLAKTSLIRRYTQINETDYKNSQHRTFPHTLDPLLPFTKSQA